MLIKISPENLASISLLLLKMAKKLDVKEISSVKAIDIAIDASIFKAKLCTRSIPGFDKDFKDAQMRIKKLKKIWKEKGTEDSWEVFRLARAKKC